MRQKVSIFSIATNVYFDYWVSLYQSAEKKLFPDADVTFHVFTNRIPEAINTQELFKFAVFHNIEDLRWPQATLKRYELIVKEMSKVDANIIMYLDADMLINEEVHLSSIIDVNEDTMVFVRHPGFWRPRFKENKTFYFAHLMLLAKDLVLKIRFGGIGAWETNNVSTAFVRRKNRKFYYCGGIWLGKKESVLDFARDSYRNITKDHANNIIAVWHDESHLNRWASENLFKEHNPTYCFAEGYSNLNSITGKITAVNKHIKTR